MQILEEPLSDEVSPGVTRTHSPPLSPKSGDQIPGGSKTPFNVVENNAKVEMIKIEKSKSEM